MVLLCLFDMGLNLPGNNSHNTREREDSIRTGGAQTLGKLPGESVWLQVSGSGTVSKGKFESSEQEDPT